MMRIQRQGIYTLALAAGITVWSACNNKNPQPAAAAAVTAPGTGTGRIAYINVDSLEEHYTYWKTKKQEIMAEQASIESELQRSAQQLQSDVAALQQKARSGSLSEAEGQAAQQRLGQMQQSLESRRATLSEQFQKKQLDFSTALQKNIDDYLAVYNKDGKYDYILSYSRSGQILFANKALDITNDVVKGLNESTPKSDSTANTK